MKNDIYQEYLNQLNKDFNTINDEINRIKNKSKKEIMSYYLKKLLKKIDDNQLQINPYYRKIFYYKRWKERIQIDSSKELQILEIGVGGGQASFWFEQKGFEVTGIEPDERNVKLINEKLKRGKIIQGFGEDYASKEKFEIIWMSHVLEHMVDLEGFLNRIKNNLKDNGIFFIEVPNAEHKPTLNASINKNPHIYHFSKYALSNFMKNLGYEIIKCDCFRPATKTEGMKNKIFKTKFPFYPRILTDENSGRDLRIILKKKY